MESSLALNNRAQTTIEFMLVFLMVLTFMELVVNPALLSAGDASLDTKNAVQAAFAAKQLAQAISATSAEGSQGLRSVVLFLPSGTQLRCDDTGAYQCKDGKMEAGCAGGGNCDFNKILFQVDSEAKTLENASTVAGCLNNTTGKAAGTCCGTVPLQLSPDISEFKCQGSASSIDGATAPKAKFKISRSSGGKLNVTRTE